MLTKCPTYVAVAESCSERDEAMLSLLLKIVSDREGKVLVVGSVQSVEVGTTLTTQLVISGLLGGGDVDLVKSLVMEGLSQSGGLTV